MSNFQLTEGETLVAKSKADRTTNAGGVQSGMMYLTSKRLVFCCSPGFSRTLIGSLASKLGSDETTIFAEVERSNIKLKKWLFWNRLMIDGEDTQIVVPKKLLKYLEGVKILDKAEESEVKGGAASVETLPPVEEKQVVDKQNYQRVGTDTDPKSYASNRSTEEKNDEFANEKEINELKEKIEKLEQKNSYTDSSTNMPKTPVSNDNNSGKGNSKTLLLILVPIEIGRASCRERV